MPDGEHGTGDRSQRILCKVRGCKARCKAGVLHADLDGDCTALGSVEAKELCAAITQCIAEQVVADDNGEDQKAAGHDAVRICGDNCCDDHDDCGGRDQRKNLDGLIRVLSEEVVHDKTEDDRQKNDTHDGEHHRTKVHVNGLASIQERQCRGEQRGKERRDSSHRNGQGHIAVGEVRHDVRGRAARAGADEDDTDRKFRGKTECQAQHPGKQRHDGVLQHGADDDVLRALEDDCEVMGL